MQPDAEDLIPDPRQIDAQLRRRYDVRGPRYTSYPTAPQFQALDRASLLKRWRARNGLQRDPGLSLYLHIPFCRARCLFCGCHTFGRRNADTVQRYVEALLAESRLAARVADPQRPLRQLALGGGTPNYLQPAQLHQLLSGLEDTWNIQQDGERSVELEPRSATPETLDVLLQHDFNRFSLGVQDFSEQVLRAVRRDQWLLQIEEVTDHLRKRGCQQINFDFIYGLPGQDLANARNTVARVANLRPSRIALYSYAHVPWMQRHQKILEGRDLPDPERKVELFLTMARGFVRAGYLPVGMDHFALPDDPLVHALQDNSLRRTFMGYTTGRGLDTLGLGASAISWVGASYSQNLKELEPYLQQVEGGQLPLFRGHLLSQDDLIRRELLLELFCTFRADLAALGARFGIDAARYFAPELQRLQPLAEDGLLTFTPQLIRVSPLGRFFIRNICMVFDVYLRSDVHGADMPKYSRTV